MARAIFALLLKELLAVLKDKKIRFVLIGPPLIQLFIFGYAATFDLGRIPIAVYDADRSVPSRDLVARFAGSPSFRLVAALKSARRIPELIDSRQAAAALLIDPRFSRDLLQGRRGPIELIVDGRNSNTALLTLGYANEVIADFERDWGKSRGDPPPAAEIVPRAWYNPNLISRLFFVPGLVATLTQVVVLLVVGLSVARERETGTFDQLLVTPLGQLDILIGKGLPGLLIGGFEASLIIIAAVGWFGVPLRGGLFPLYLGLVLFALAVTGIGLMISSLAATQQQALLGAFLFMVPSITLSGFATPIANMPPAVQYLTLLNPLRYFLVVVRGVFLEGAGLGALWQQYWPMTLIGLLTLSAAGWLFRRRIY